MKRFCKFSALYHSWISHNQSFCNISLIIHEFGPKSFSSHFFYTRNISAKFGSHTPSRFRVLIRGQKKTIQINHMASEVDLPAFQGYSAAVLILSKAILAQAFTHCRASVAVLIINIANIPNTQSASVKIQILQYLINYSWLGPQNVIKVLKSCAEHFCQISALYHSWISHNENFAISH